MIAGRLVPFISLVVVWAIMYFAMESAKKGNLPSLRSIAGIDAIEEAIGRATEMGKPILFTGGMGDVTDANGPQTVAGLEILAHLAGRTADQDIELIVTVCKENLQPITEVIVQDAYARAGKAGAYKPEMVRFLSPAQMAYACATASIIEREQVAATVMVGAYWAESMIIAEAGAAVGAIQIGGTARMIQLPFFVIACDYTLIGEEIYAGGAYLSKHPLRLGSLAGQDTAKLIGVVLMLVAAVANTLGMPLVDLLGK